MFIYLSLPLSWKERLQNQSQVYYPTALEQHHPLAHYTELYYTVDVNKTCLELCKTDFVCLQTIRYDVCV